MGLLMGLFGVILFLVSLLVVVVILFQDNKAGGLAGALGGGAPDSPFGARAGERLARWTLYLCIAFFVLVIARGVLNNFSTPGAARPNAPPADSGAPAR